MEFSGTLIKGKLIKRYKRFLADIALPDGEIVTAHCPNTGAMTGCAEPGWTAYLRYDNNPKRKLAYTWELSINDKGEWIGINTHNANKLVAEMLQHSPHLMPFNFATFKPEQHWQNSQSRFDFLLTDIQDTPCHILEVKSVTLNESGIGFFPDAVSKRGTRHCQELTQLVNTGIACSMLFCVQHTGVRVVRPAEHIDPKYAQALREAKSAGVSILACGCAISQENIKINQLLPVKL